MSLHQARSSALHSSVTGSLELTGRQNWLTQVAREPK
jgi:hypothetical protein